MLETLKGVLMSHKALSAGRCDGPVGVTRDRNRWVVTKPCQRAGVMDLKYGNGTELSFDLSQSPVSGQV